ncbi:MAG TPA: VIT and VWA domain-containing protein [Thermoanaerobaculia bacterium]|nr:VIT and VWA domain-containing protein [Thermoanaerobaculia bacterium]
MKAWRLVLLALAVCAPAATPANAAGLLVADGGFGGVLEIREQDVRVTINNGVAVTQVEQVFRNTEDRVVEALYTFPVPKGASVANFSMWINGREMVGEVVEKERARQIYESYKQPQNRKDPGLLEQVDFKTFEMRVFPIAARAEQRVRITYYQELDFDHDWATYVYPLATDTRQDVDSRTRGRFALTLDVKSEVPIEEMESPSHRDDFVVVHHDDNHAQASLEADQGDLNRDVVLAFHLERPRTGFDLIASRAPENTGEDGFFLLTLTAGEELAESDQDMDYVFLLDVSGSMDEDGKLDLSRGSLGAFIRALGPRDRFEVLTFNVAAQELFQKLQTADDPGKATAVEFLDAQRARGGTVLEPALRAAYRYKDPARPLNVVVLSDGMTDQGERSILLRLIGERPEGTRVFCIGVGNEVNRALLEQLAEDAGGLAAFVSRGDSFERQAQAFRRKLVRPAASDLEIRIEGADVYDLEPQRLPNLYHGMPVRLYGRYRSAGPVKLHLKADVGGQPLERTVDLDIPEDPKDAENPEIERMWAWHRVQRLLKDADRAGSRSGVLDEIVRLGEGFSIVTEYTSFLVLENDAEYKRWQIERRNALRIERDRRAQARVRDELDRIRDKTLAGLGPEAVEQRASVNPVTPAAAPPRTAPAPAPAQPSNRGDVDLGGGGALDPFSIGLVLLLAAASLAASRRRA